MNTTFTTYAEKKAKQFLNLLQGYTKGIRMTAILILLLIGVSNAWAAVNHTGGYVYFLKPSTWSESTVMMWIGHDTYTSVYTMTKVSNTDNLYRYSMPSWGGANYVTFANVGSAWNSGNFGSGSRTSLSHYTNVYNNYGFNSGSYYVVVPASTSNNAGITINYTGTTASTINLTTKAIASDKAHGTVSVSGYYMSNATTASTRSAVSSTASNATASTTLAPGSTATFKATASTGYEFAGWYDAATGGNQLSTSTTYTYKYDISYTGKTVYARFKAKQSAITLNQENATTTGTTSVTATYGVTMPTIATLPTRNGYDFAGYFDAKSGGTKYYNADASSAKNWDKTAETITLYAQWTAKDITINWNANGGSVTPISSTYTYDGDAITLPTPSYAGHRFLGWYTAASGGTQITDVGTTNKPYTTVTYYAHWEVSIVEHTVTFAVGTGSTEYGTLTAATNSGNITSGSNIVEGTSVTFTATPETGYEVEGWYTNAACTEGKHDAGSTTYTTSITGVTNVYVKFVEKKWSVAFTAGTGGFVTTPSSTPQTVGQVTGISIAATPATGYTFNQWTITSGAGSFTSEATTNSNTFKPTNNSTVTASFNETMSTLTTSNKYDVGNPEYAIPTKSVNSIGVATTATVKATAAGNGYTFTGWTFTNCTRTDGGATDATSITVRSNGDGKAATVTANYKEDLATTKWYISGNGNGSGNDLTPGSPFTGWATNGIQMFKKSGHSTEEIYYCTITANTVASDDAHFPFKVYNATTSKYWGNNGYWVTKENNSPTLSSNSGDNMKFRPYLTGTYEFKLDATNASSPVLTVTWPVYNQLRISAANPADATNTGEFDMTGSGTYTVTRSLNANTTYTFKIVYDSEWYGANNGNLTRASSSKTLSTSSNNLTLKTDFAGNYTFTFNSSTKNLTVTYPTAYTLTYGSGAGGSGTVTADNSIKSGDLVLAGTSVSLTATPADGYDFAAWYSDQACEGDAISSNNPYIFSINSNTTLYAKWKAQSFTLTWELDGGRITEEGTQAGSVAVGTTLAAPTVEKDYYDFASWNPTVPTTMPAANVTYTAQWTPKKYAITYKDQGDKTFFGTHDSGYPTQHTYNTTTTLLGATKSGYTFAGWYRDSECAGERVEALGVDITEAITLYAKWDVASYTINFDTQEGTGGTPSVTAQYGAKLSAITIPSLDGYLFDGYYTQTGGKGIKYYNADGTTNETMPHNISKLYAKWIGYDHCIFFKNTLGTLGWKDVYVYTFSADAWDSYVGVKVKGKYQEYGKMTQIGKTDIFYYVLTNQTGFNYIAFSNAAMNTYNEFYGNKAIYRGDRSDQLQLFIPNATGSTKVVNQTTYYNDGIWMKYNSKESGYDWSGKTADSNWSDHALQSEKKGDYSFTATVSLKAGTNYEFKISNVGKDADNEKIKETAWYGWNGTMTQTNCTNKHFKHNTGTNAMITPTVDGDYTFTVYLGDGKVMVSLDYPLSTWDYRLVYEDNTLSKIHEGHYLKKRTTGEILDTVSFFVRKDKTPQILLQQCTKIVSGKPTWETVNNGTYNITVNADGVYNFVLKQTNSGTHNATLETSATHKYTGDYYIRTDAAEGGWKSYRQASNRMNYSTYADSHSEFNHYFCSYQERGCNVKFIVANDYSKCLTDTMDNDDIIRPNQSSVGCLPANANIRFGWDSETNQLSRAYISGAGLVQDRFLVLMGNDYLKDAEGNTLIAGTNGSPRYGLKANEEIFADKGNWIYQVDVQACNQTTIRLSALYNGEEQLFKGARNDISLLNSTEPKYYKVRMIYDFKTNHMISAWLLDEQGNTIEGQGSLASDILVIRKNQDQANQLTFIDDAERTDVGVVYGVMTFDKFFLNNIDKEGNPLNEKDNNFKTIYERALYWISFPFNVKLKDIFGFSNYGDHWILEEYNGEARAENGAWVDSESYWEYITDSEYELEAGKGYVLCLDLDKMGVNSDVFQHTNEVSLYFPSKEKVGTINGATTSITLDPYTCTIERDKRNIYDSNWHLIGVPRFADITTENINIIPQPTQADVGFYYKYGSNGEYTVQKSGKTTFQTMSAYLVQYAGVINWTSTGITVPAAIAARKNSLAEPEQVHLRLEIAQDDEMADQTFVQLQQEGATAEFDMNLDLTKMLHSGTNIYTLAGEQGIKSAGNAMPMSECVVPVGVKIDAEGEYTFRMPDGTEGMVVELIDYERDITTNLLLFDYTVTLPAGSNESRFALHIQPNKSGVTTGVEEAYPQPLPKGKGAKFLIDGKLVIRTAEGVIYDAQGHVVQ